MVRFSFNRPGFRQNVRGLSALTALALCLVPALSAHAASYVYGSRQRTVNAGVLIATGSTSAALKVFYGLNQRADVKPFGWRIVNPGAPGGGDPSTAAYWAVSLPNTSAAQLQKYDILYLPLDGASFAPADTEKLRQYVNAGGQLWVESASAAAVTPLIDTQITTAAVPALTEAAPAHPLTMQPYALTIGDLATLAAQAFGTVGNTAAGNGEFGNLYATALQSTAAPVVCAGHLGGGEIIVDGLNAGGAISANLPATNITPALKFLCNVISWNEAHPAENKTSAQNASGNDPSSYALKWADTQVSGSAAPAVWGNTLFVMDGRGTLRAFDAFSTASPIAPLWTAATSLGVNASAPTVGVYNGQTFVLAEKSDGTVYEYNAVSGVSVALPGSGGGGGGFTGLTPSPTYYDGRVYAGQTDATLYVKSLSGGGSAGGGVKIPLDPGITFSESVTASPAVGAQAYGSMTSDIVATVPTTQNMYSVFLGSRADLLQSLGTPAVYNINRGRLSLSNLYWNSDGFQKTYDVNGALGAQSFSGAGSTPDTTITSGTWYADYDADLVKSFITGGAPNNQTLNVAQISPASYGAVNSGNSAGGVLSSPATDRTGDVYYTVNSGGFSYLFGVHHDSQYQITTLKFRFRLPTTGDASLFAAPGGGASWNYQDADGVNYSSLIGYSFVGAPVVDSQGLVYVAAQNGGSVVLLCFNANQEIAADVNPPDIGDSNRATFSQPDEMATAQTNTLVSLLPDAPRNRGQVQVTGNRAVFFNFGAHTGGLHQIAGNMTEPQPVNVSPGVEPTDANTPILTAQSLLLHTNLVWFTPPQTVTGGISGLSKVGSALFFCDGGGTLYKVGSAPTVGSGKLAAPTLTAQALGIGAVSAAPSAGGAAMGINGSSGLASLTQQFTVITDNNRVLETDADGNAVWAVDATLQAAGTGTAGTRLDFNRPTSLSQVAANDYLLADVGNNRCVRFDRDGNVLWELTRFYDANNLMAAGSPVTLSQPTSVQARAPYTDGSGNIANAYLIADSGNNRIVEVTDTYTPAGVLVANHVLTWVSHTFDQQGRSYRYSAATYFPSTGTPTYVAAVVSNTRLAPLAVTGAAGQLGPAGGDGAGGTLLFTNFTAAANVAYAYTTFGAGGMVYPVRNPRFLTLYAPASGALPGLLYADDNGAFDLTYDTTNAIYDVAANSLAFTPAQYQAMTLPSVGVPSPTLPPLAPTYNRTGLPFTPTSVIGLGVNALGVSRYLICNTGGQSELGNNPNRIGGEVFEVDGSVAVGAYSNGTLGRPGLTSPLTQPTFAIRSGF